MRAGGEGDRRPGVTNTEGLSRVIHFCALARSRIALHCRPFPVPLTVRRVEDGPLQLHVLIRPPAQPVVRTIRSSVSHKPV